jgi:cell wall-associated NlpC family hydrolase
MPGSKADLSKSKKVSNVAKGVVKGAQGKNAAGAAAGGQLTGALAGGAQALAEVIPKKYLIGGAIAIVLAPFVWFVAYVTVISMVLGAITGFSTVLTSSSASASTGNTQQVVSTTEDAATGTPTPWEVLLATQYYETGNGSAVAQNIASCPKGAVVNAICATVDQSTTNSSGVAIATSAGSGGTPGGNSSGGSTTPIKPPKGLPPGATSSHGRNGTVPRVLSPTSPDWTTTNTADWACIRDAESGGNYKTTSGAYGILKSTWHADGYPGTPGTASPALQNRVALHVLNYLRHFWGAFNDSCTETTSGENPIQPILPGVETPPNYTGPGAGTGPTVSGSNGGSCSASGVGPYCLSGANSNGQPLTTSQETNLSFSSRWVAKTVGQSLAKAGFGTGVDLTDGVSIVSGSPPVLSPTNSVAAKQESAIKAALAALPIDGNSSIMDTNIFNLAVDWAVWYSPPGVQTCSTTPSGPGSIIGGTSIPGPLNGTTPTTITLTTAQVAVAAQIVNTANATGGTGEAGALVAVTAALSATELGGQVSTTGGGVYGLPSTWGSTGQLANVVSATNLIFGTPQGSLPGLTQISGWQSMTPGKAAAAVTGLPASTMTGWVAGATQLVTTLISPTASCTSSVHTPAGTGKAALAIVAAKSEVGRPYVWGGGGTNGPSGSASACLGGFVEAGFSGVGNPCSAAYAAQTGKPGFDCSGLMQYAYAKAGISLPRTSETQYTYAQAIGPLTTNVSQLQPGDLVFFSFQAGNVDHVGMYLGNNLMIQGSETGSDVQIVPMYLGGFVGGGPV